jgi:hypothetical protein
MRHTILRNEMQDVRAEEDALLRRKNKVVKGEHDAHALCRTVLDAACWRYGKQTTGSLCSISLMDFACCDGLQCDYGAQRRSICKKSGAIWTHGYRC